MCGRYYIADEQQIKEIKKILDQIDSRQKNRLKTGEIFPTDPAPVITARDKTELLEWGFPKFNAKGVIINARSETAAQKPMFAKSLRERRCVIPCSGFFEWQKRDPTMPKTKYLFTSDQHPVMYLAGIWNHYQDKDTSRFVILTRDANISMADIHDRMPVVLYENEINDYIEDDNFSDFIFQRNNILLKRQESFNILPLFQL